MGTSRERKNINKKQTNAIPNVAYKYAPMRNWDYFFRDWTIRFTPPEDLNDPYECEPHLGNTGYPGGDIKFFIDALSLLEPSKLYAGIVSQYGHTIRGEKISEAFISDFIESLKRQTPEDTQASFHSLKMCMIDVFKTEIGFLCMARRNSNLLMWSHYADSHKGFAVGLNLTHPFFNNQINYMTTTIGGATPVNYRRKRISKQLIELAGNMYEFFYIKNIDWKYEQELRIVVPLECNKFEWIEQASKGVVRISKNIIKSIIFGAGVHDDEIKNKCATIRSQPGCEHIVLRKASLHPKKYALVIEDI